MVTDPFTYIPKEAHNYVQFLIEQHAFDLKIVAQRESKHGDFRKLPNGKFQITVNNNLNPFQFLLTLVHEIAHHITYQKFGRVQPHGKQWKIIFQHIMLPLLKPTVFPTEVLPFLAHYLKNPRASTDSDVHLSLALKKHSKESGKNFIFEVPLGAFFQFKKSMYRQGVKRRTRYECTNTKNNKVYLFNQNTEVTVLNNNYEH